MRIKDPYFTLRSLPAHEKITFWHLRSHLIAFVNARIKNGDFTERGLARILGISQPQLHNVLKGVRKLQFELADELLKKLDISVLDLLDGPEPSRQLLLPYPPIGFPIDEKPL